MCESLLFGAQYGSIYKSRPTIWAFSWGMSSLTVQDVFGSERNRVARHTTRDNFPAAPAGCDKIVVLDVLVRAWVSGVSCAVGGKFAHVCVCGGETWEGVIAIASKLWPDLRLFIIAHFVHTNISYILARSKFNLWTGR